MITFIGSGRQCQIDNVFQKVKDRGFSATLIDFESNDKIEIQATNQFVTMSYAGISLLDTKVVWAEPKYLVPQFGSDQAWADRYTARTHWKALNDNLLSILPGKVLNRGRDVTPLHSKLYQLKEAAKLGFNIGATLVTNSGAKISQFRKDKGVIVTKALDDANIPVFSPSLQQHVLMTCDVDEDLLVEMTEDQPFPTCVQRKLRKVYEYRVIVVREKIFAFRIDPNQHPLMATDYRRGGYMVGYEPCEIASNLEHSLLRLHKHFCLFSGSYDLVEESDGSIVFLEVNPWGVWSYLDTLCDGAVSTGFADEIAAEYESLA